jgi:hypothetical protein
MAVFSKVFAYQRTTMLSARLSVRYPNDHSASHENPDHFTDLLAPPESTTIVEAELVLQSSEDLQTDQISPCIEYNTRSLSNISHGYTQRPQEKYEIVWFCSICHDGPLADWRNQCTNCGHERCGYCAEEKTKKRT